MDDAISEPSGQEEIDYVELDDIIEKEFGSDKENLIMILQAIQRRYNYLPEPALSYLSVKIDVPISKIYGVATFYATFKLKPRGRNIISVCRGTACHVRGGQVIADNIQKELNIKIGDTTDDMLFTLETVRCLGACALGPVMEINGEYYGQLTTKKADTVLQTYKAQEAKA